MCRNTLNMKTTKIGTMNKDINFKVKSACCVFNKVFNYLPINQVESSQIIILFAVQITGLLRLLPVFAFPAWHRYLQDR